MTAENWWSRVPNLVLPLLLCLVDPILIPVGVRLVLDLQISATMSMGYTISQRFTTSQRTRWNARF